jgi:hypothetical protein
LKERTQHSCEDNIEIDLKGISWESVEGIHLIWDSDQWQALMTTVMNVQVPQRAGNFLIM